MNRRDEEGLDRVFHEPARLAIVSHLVHQADGAPFPDLKAACGLTDGNLARHLAMLAEAGAVSLEKQRVARKSRTLVRVTDAGAAAFARYLRSLRSVVLDAKRRLRAGRHPPPPPC